MSSLAIGVCHDLDRFSTTVRVILIKDLARLLKPGGMLAETTRGKSIIDYAKNLVLNTNGQTHAQGLALAFQDWQEALAEYDRGQFVYRPYPRDPLGPGYGEACIPRAFFNEKWPVYFSEVLFYPETSQIGQAIVVGKKTDNSRPLPPESATLEPNIGHY
ncbi:MAG: hypothetical protein ACU841_11005 [Gammaproteobacteria bacterium]